MNAPINFKKYCHDSASFITTALHLDANEGIYVRQLVTSVLSEIFTLEYPDTRWASGELISIGPYGVNPGAREFGWREYGSNGEASIVADNATDLPVADIEGDFQLQKIVNIATSIQYSLVDIDAMKMQGPQDIATMKAAAAREVHDRKLDQLITSGDPAQGITGVGFVPGSFHVNAPSGVSWDTATPAQILADLTAGYNASYNGTNGVEYADSVAVASSVWVRLSTLQNSIASDKTVLEFLKLAFPGIKTWRDDPKLNTLGDGGTRCAMIYRNDPTRLRAVMPKTLVPLPLVQDGMVFKQGFYSRYAGLAVPKPLSIVKLQGI